MKVTHSNSAESLLKATYNDEEQRGNSEKIVLCKETMRRRLPSGATRTLLFLVCCCPFLGIFFYKVTTQTTKIVMDCIRIV